MVCAFTGRNRQTRLLRNPAISCSACMTTIVRFSAAANGADNRPGAHVVEIGQSARSSSAQ